MTEKRKIAIEEQDLRYIKRINFGKIPSAIQMPNLVDVQQRSFDRFLQLDCLPEERENIGLQEIFTSVFPIIDYTGTSSLDFVYYEIGIWECSCGNLTGLHQRYEWSCKCGNHSGKGDYMKNHREKGLKLKCSTCHGEIIYKRCPKCDTRVYLKMRYEVNECKERGMSFTAPLKVTIRLSVWEKDPETETKTIRDIKEQEVYLGEMPLMTDLTETEEGKIRTGTRGTFIINGTERVIVNQMHRSPGVFFKHDSGKSHKSGKIMYSARLIPYRGSWLELEFDVKDILHVRIDRKRKFLVTVLLRGLGLVTNEEILRTFYETETIKRVDDKFTRRLTEIIVGTRFDQDIEDKDSGKIILKAGVKITKKFVREMKAKKKDEFILQHNEIEGFVVAQDIVDFNTGEVIVECNQRISKEHIQQILASGIEQFEILSVEGSPVSSPIHETLAKDKIQTPEEAKIEIYKKIRPGDPLTSQSAAHLFERLFFDSKYYDLSKVGRLMLNRKLKLDIPTDKRTLTPQDVIETIRHLCILKNEEGNVDDIDHLGNRRVRCVGELLQNQIRVGLVRMERSIKERMSVQDLATSMPYDLINSKPIMAAIKEFFGSSQLSQFMDQTNPLAELTHKRRLSALGPGGLSRERAGFEVRDVHTTHYGRICPIETPEGPNVGLISSLSTYARVTDYGFIETPYRKVVKGQVTNEIVYLTALDEDLPIKKGIYRKYVIAQANARLDENNRFIDERIRARCGGDFVMVTKDDVDFMDVSPKQLVSISASLIPFLENDDANRALMGSNMQRQAVPLLKTEPPLVGTGMEYLAARDSGIVVKAKRSGIVESVDANRIIVVTDTHGKQDGSMNDAGMDIYNLKIFQRSNQNTCINQVPIVRKGDRVKKDQILADGPATNNGELALGQNVLVAFMPWRGYNFEDAILVSERLVKDDRYTSIHIMEFSIECHDTKLGKEEITRDIPNTSEEALKNLDESGIICIGAEVKSGDVLVGKVTPKGETQLTPEEKLLRAIFGEKAGDVRDASLVTPPGIEGTIIDVKVFSRKGVEKDLRSQEIENLEKEKIEKDFHSKSEIIRDKGRKKLINFLEGKTLRSNMQKVDNDEVILKKGSKLTRAVLEEFSLDQIDRIQLKDEEANERKKELLKKIEDHINIIKIFRENRKERFQKGDELPPGVIKMVKVYIAVKRKLSVGDKMAGRHGNKGVLANILPEENMPFLPDGTPIEIVLNPLGVPSRMNVGQILETNLGWVAKAIGKHVATPVFDGARETEICEMLGKAGIPDTGQSKLFDGRTGEAFDQPVTVGYIYMMKLAHLVDDKIHARSIGPYSLVTQQPLGGKAQFGGQRLGEMEVWALEAYGAAYTLQELLTVKSDEVAGRTKIYQAIVKGDTMLEPGLPESFNVLLKELQSLCLDIQLITVEPDRDEAILPAETLFQKEATSN